MYVNEADLVDFLVTMHSNHCSQSFAASDLPEWKKTSEQRYNEYYFGTNNPFYTVNSSGVVSVHRNIFCIGWGLPKGKICDGGNREAIEKLEAAGLIEFKYSFGQASKGWTLPKFRPADM